MPEIKQEATIILKGDEIAQLEALLDSMPHGYAKKIIQFINATQQTRMTEGVNNNLQKEKTPDVDEKKRDTINSDQKDEK